MMSEQVHHHHHHHHVVPCSVLTPCCPDYCLLLLLFDDNITIPFVWAGLCCTLPRAVQPQWKRKQCMRICLFLFFCFVCFCSVLDFFSAIWNNNKTNFNPSFWLSCFFQGEGLWCGILGCDLFVIYFVTTRCHQISHFDPCEYLHQLWVCTKTQNVLELLQMFASSKSKTKWKPY